MYLLIVSRSVSQMSFFTYILHIQFDIWPDGLTNVLDDCHPPGFRVRKERVG